MKYSDIEDALREAHWTWGVGDDGAVFPPKGGYRPKSVTP
jgi:hypothetical protein